MRSPQPSPSTLSIVVQRTRDLKSRMRESRTSGSVGAPGGRLPGATRPPSARSSRSGSSSPAPTRSAPTPSSGPTSDGSGSSASARQTRSWRPASRRRGGSCRPAARAPGADRLACRWLGSRARASREDAVGRCHMNPSGSILTLTARLEPDYAGPSHRRTGARGKGPSSRSSCTVR